MRTLVVAGTSAGAGVTTLAALAHHALRGGGSGTPWLLGPAGGDLPERTGDLAVARVDDDAAVWDAGVLRADAALGRLAAPGTAVAVVSPATPLGVADAHAVLERLGAVDAYLAARSCLVLTGARRGTRAPRAAAGVAVLTVPHDRALHPPGPVDAQALLPGTRRAVQAWQRWVVAALGGS